MALDRKKQKIFAKNAQSTDLGVVGSKNAGNPQYDTDIETIQSLSNWETGLRAQVSNSDAPYLQDQNSIFYVITSQLAYLFQAGIAEWQVDTEYISGRSVVLKSGKIYLAIANSTSVEPEVTTGWANSWICLNYWGGLQGNIGNQRDLTALVSGGYYTTCTSNLSSRQKDIVLNDSIPLGNNNSIPDGTKIRVCFTKGSNVLLYDGANYPYLSMTVNGVSLTAQICINGYVDVDSVGAKFYCSPNEIVEFVFRNGMAYCDNVVSYTQRAILSPSDTSCTSVRIWRDGYCEQEGYVARSGNTTTITLAYTMSDQQYFCDGSYGGSSLTSGDHDTNIYTYIYSTSQIKILADRTPSNPNRLYWQVKGYIG